MGALRTARDVLAPMIDGPLEYSPQAQCRRFMPALIKPGHRICSCWRLENASSMVRLILSDPRLLRYGGHAPLFWAHLRDDPGGGRELTGGTTAVLLLTGLWHARDAAGHATGRCAECS